MSKIKHSGLDQYGTEPFEHQQFGTAGVEAVNILNRLCVAELCDGWKDRPTELQKNELMKTT